MQARIVAAARGVRWLAEGWRLFRAAPLGWLAMVFAYLLLTQVLALVPVVGAAAAALLVPAFSVGLMAAARSAASAGRVEIAQLFEGFRGRLRSQLVLGAVYLACLMVVIVATTLADGENGLRAVLAGRRPAQELRPDELIVPLAVFALAYTPVMMLFWFAPPLAAWHGAAPAKALFYSFFACWLNWRAFLAYGTVTACVMLAVPFLVLAGLALASGGSLRPQAATLVLPLALALLPALFASFYASYRDVFGPAE